MFRRAWVAWIVAGTLLELAAVRAHYAGARGCTLSSLAYELESRPAGRVALWTGGGLLAAHWLIEPPVRRRRPR